MKTVKPTLDRKTLTGLAVLMFVFATTSFAKEKRMPESRVSVTFSSEGVPMKGTLFLAAASPEPRPTVLVVGPWLNVKEQVAYNYARKLTARGFNAFAFDFRHWGESGGEPREYESPRAKVADIHNAVRFLATRPEVDRDRIGVLAVCFGVGYVAAAADDPNIKSIATVAAWVHDVPSITALFGADEIARRRRAGKAAAEAYEKDKTVEYVPAASVSDKAAAMYFPDPNFYYADSAHRGAIPQWTNRYAVMGWEEWLDFDGVAAGTNITQPLMVVHSDNSALPDNARKFFANAKGAKELVWLQGEHTQFYDTEPYITRAADAVAAHFRETLGGARREDVAARSVAATREFFAALEAADIPRFLEVWAENGVQEMPYAPAGFPQRLDGRAAIERQYGPLPAAFESMRFPVQMIAATDDPRVVVAQFGGSIALKSGGRYDNRYVGVFRYNDEGKLAHYYEYFDPYTLLNGFPGAAQSGPDGPKWIVQEVARRADARDWSALRTLFSENVEVDYTSVGGGSPARMAADALIAGWKDGLGRYNATHHTFAPADVQIDGTSAIARFQGQATHVRTENGSDVRWTCGGEYLFRFVRDAAAWKLTAVTFEMKWEQGTR
jgi:hypothetical protein